MPLICVPESLTGRAGSCQTGRMGERTAVVTGATGAIGRELVTELLTRGMSVVALCRDPARLGELTDDPRVRAVRWDQGEGSEPPGEVREAARVDVLVHTAGVAPVTPVADTTVAGLTRLMSINVVSAAVLTATLLPALRATGGHVVLVNSAPGLRGVPGWSGYLGSKSVLRVLADSLRVEEPALRVTTVYPGAVATDLLREVRHARGQEYDPDRAVGVRSPARSHRLRHRSRSRAPHPGRRTSSTLPGRGRTPHRCHPPRSRSQRPPRPRRSCTHR